MRAERLFQQTRVVAAGTRAPMNPRSCSNMKEAAGLFMAALAVLVGRLGGTEPDGGLCVERSCFAVFRHTGDYTSAQSHCEERNGRLMSVSSFGSRDALAQLMRNFSGRFWIGLHRSIGCPNATSPLRGYEWTAKDAEGDLANWAPSFDGSCSSPRCVTVSQADRLRWVQEACDAPVTGFLCEYHFAYSCKSIGIAGNAPAYDTPLGFGGGDLHALPPGSIATLTPSKRKFVCSDSWVEAPWSCEILEGGCEHKCAMNDDHEPSCSCPPGLSVNPANEITCEADAQDPCARLLCEYACLEGEGGAHACACDHGFTLAPDGRSCVDFNDCSDERQCPEENTRCVNTVGGFECECEGGFKLTDGSCVDHDECASAPCEHMCDNTPGSYKCSCYGGYRVDPLDTNKCELHCGKEECVAECDPNDKYQCFCPDGYIAEEREHHTVCIDMDECGDSYCDHGCRNTYGGYVCSCRKGFTLVDEVFCARNEDEEEEAEGSGEAATTPNAPTAATPPTHEVAPTRQPSAVTVGGLVAIIVCCVLVVVVVVFLSQHILNKRGKVERGAASKAPDGGETHSLHGMGSEA